ncbi:comE operon protein 1, putative [Pseudonocardia sp. N23]|nr:comE operon protein 1, putative [Pseudonocardia sp. N23]
MDPGRRLAGALAARPLPVDPAPRERRGPHARVGSAPGPPANGEGEFWDDQPEWIVEPDTVDLPGAVPPAARPGWGGRLRDRFRRRRGAAVRRWVPEPVQRARLDPGRPGAVALTIVTALAALAAAVGVWLDRPRAEALPPGPVAGLSPIADAPAGTAPPGGTPGGQIVVSVVGTVARPGLVRVPGGARVADVVDAAGGVLPGTEVAGLNLARRVSDGEQVVVGAAAPDAVARPGTAPPEPATGTGTGAAGGKVDLNSASVAQLDGLPGVGPVTAQRIVDWRTRNGRFSRVDQLREIDGIGERKYAQLRELVVAG